MEVVFGLTAAICFGLADFFARFTTRSIGVYHTLLSMQFVGLIGISLYLFITGDIAHPHISEWQAWLWCIVAALVNIVSYIALYKAFELGKLAVVSPIASSYAAVTVVLSVLTGEKLSIGQVIGIIAVLLGVILAALHKEEQTGEHKEPLKSQGGLPPGVIWAIGAAVGLGVTFWLLGFAVTPKLGETLPVWTFRFVAICVMLPLTLLSSQRLHWHSATTNAQLVGIGLLDTGAFIASTLGFATGQVAIVSVLASLYSAVAVVLAWIFLKERLRLLQWVGIAIIMAGIVLSQIQ